MNEELTQNTRTSEKIVAYMEFALYSFNHRFRISFYICSVGGADSIL